jgi:CRISPR-associated protein Cas1
MDDLHLLPKIRDSLTYLYVEHARIDRLQKSIAIHDAKGYTPAPVASLSVLMLGPGTSITHAAIQTLAENNCLVVWCGEENVRFYASGTGGTRSAAPLLLQARLASDERTRLEVVRRMYAMRFGEVPDKGDTVESLRGREGVRVREAYAKLAEAFGVVWQGRNYDRTSWATGDPVNRALSCANSCLYGLCHAAILATGYSPGIGFIHTGKQLSFVYDIADLYKVEVTIPVAFRIAGRNPPQLEREIRMACRDRFRETKLLSRIVTDIQKVLDVTLVENSDGFASDSDPALPTELWTPAPEVEQAFAEEVVTSSPRTTSPTRVTVQTATPLNDVAQVRAFSLVVREQPPEMPGTDATAMETAKWNALWDGWDPEREGGAEFVTPGYRFRVPQAVPDVPGTKRGRRRKGEAT